MKREKYTEAELAGMRERIRIAERILSDAYIELSRAYGVSHRAVKTTEKADRWAKRARYMVEALPTRAERGVH